MEDAPGTCRLSLHIVPLLLPFWDGSQLTLLYHLVPWAHRCLLLHVSVLLLLLSSQVSHLATLLLVGQSYISPSLPAPGRSLGVIAGWLSLGVHPRTFLGKVMRQSSLTLPGSAMTHSAGDLAGISSPSYYQTLCTSWHRSNNRLRVSHLPALGRVGIPNGKESLASPTPPGVLHFHFTLYPQIM